MCSHLVGLAPLHLPPDLLASWRPSIRTSAKRHSSSFFMYWIALRPSTLRVIHAAHGHLNHAKKHRLEAVLLILPVALETMLLARQISHNLPVALLKQREGRRGAASALQRECEQVSAAVVAAPGDCRSLFVKSTGAVSFTEHCVPATHLHLFLLLSIRPRSVCDGWEPGGAFGCKFATEIGSSIW